MKPFCLQFKFPQTSFLRILFFSTPLLCSCETDLIPYALEQGLRQGSILLQAQKIEDVLKKPGLDPKTERLLRLTQNALKFAQTDLKMKTGTSYRTYHSLNRNYLTQIILAAYPNRLEPYLFKFPIVGAVPYKGFFEAEDAIAFENKLKSEGLDTYRREVDAFSSLGWFSDPILSTMLDSEAKLVELLFHELTHLNFYFQDESDFNEAFASYFGHKAAIKMIEKMPTAFQSPETSRAELEKSKEREEKLSKKIKAALDYGHRFYAQKPLPPRTEFFEWLRQHFSSDDNSPKMKKLQWNNALLLSLSTYYELVPNIEQYQNQKSWDEATYLRNVVSEGPKIIPHILGKK